MYDIDHIEKKIALARFLILLESTHTLPMLCIYQMGPKDIFLTWRGLRSICNIFNEVPTQAQLISAAYPDLQSYKQNKSLFFIKKSICNSNISTLIHRNDLSNQIANFKTYNILHSLRMKSRDL